MNAIFGRQGTFWGVAAAVMLLVSFDAMAGRRSYTRVAISGSAPTSAVAGQTYGFQPAVSGGYSDRRSFSIRNKPRWAYFSVSTGKLSGTPKSGHVGRYSDIRISVSDGRTSARLPAFTITVKAPATAPEPAPEPAPTTTNNPPTISGTSAAQVMVGSAYQFRPSATDTNGDTLSFSIANRPEWAMFDTATGMLGGTPTAANVGSYGNIVITVSDGRGGSASLPAFAVSVLEAAMGSATVSWMPPTQNTDGSALTNLSGYRIQYGTQRGGPYSKSVDISNPSVSRHVVDNLTSGTYYFVVVARNSTGAESQLSNEAIKTIN